MRCSDDQVRRLMQEYSRCGEIGKAAVKAGMNRKTAAKYIKEGRLPSDMDEPRSWRTREDPFEADWPKIEAMLEASPELEANSIFEHLTQIESGRYEPGQLRTLQRRVKRWRAMHGPAKEVFFSQAHRPGEAAQTDFTRANELAVTVDGEPFQHLLCHTILPYSLWQSATVCRSESMCAIRRGVQTALFKLGRVPEFHQTDNSTAATHKPGASGESREVHPGSSKGRGFNDDYLGLMEHFGVKPRTTAVGAKEQNGSVEALNGALKRSLEQHLLLRGSRDFASESEYEAWVQGVLHKKNGQRGKRLEEELQAMRVLRVARLSEFTETIARVTGTSTIRIKRNTYSVSSRLIGERVRVRIYENRIEVYYGGELQLLTSRLVGDGGRSINYRHVIDSLLRKPSAFERWRHREELFPSLAFRRGHDALDGAYDRRRCDLEYLRILKLAADTYESEVEQALIGLLEAGVVPLAETLLGLIAAPAAIETPELEELTVDLDKYDMLLGASPGLLAPTGAGVDA